MFYFESSICSHKIKQCLLAKISFWSFRNQHVFFVVKMLTCLKRSENRRLTINCSKWIQYRPNGRKLLYEHTASSLSKMITPKFISYTSIILTHPVYIFNVYGIFWHFSSLFLVLPTYFQYLEYIFSFSSIFLAFPVYI